VLLYGEADEPLRIATAEHDCHPKRSHIGALLPLRAELGVVTYTQ
jgi:hypothetical protein